MSNASIGDMFGWRQAFSGPGRIAGDPPVDSESPDGRVTINGVPASRRVVLFDTAEMRPIGAVRSGVDGTYEFTGLRTEVEPGVPVFYTLIAYDGAGVYDAVIRDRVAPVVP